MRVTNLVTGKKIFVEMKDPFLACARAMEVHDKINYVRPHSYQDYEFVVNGNQIRCGNWVVEMNNPVNPKILFNSLVRITHGDFKGVIGRVNEDFDTRIPFVSGVGFVMAEHLEVLN